MKNLCKLIVLAAVAFSVAGCATFERKMAEADERTAAKRATNKAIREGRIGGTGRKEIDQGEISDFYNSQFNKSQKTKATSEGE